MINNIWLFQENFNNKLQNKLSNFVDNLLDYYLSYIEDEKIYPDILYKIVIIYLWKENLNKAKYFLNKLLDKNNNYEKYKKLKQFFKKTENSFKLNKSFDTNIKINFSKKINDFYNENKDKFDNQYFYYEIFYNILGNYCLKTSNVEDALNFFILSYLYGKNLSNFYKNIGNYYYYKNNLKLSYSFYNKALSLNNNYIDAKIELSYVAAELDKPQESLNILKEIHNKNPKYPDISYRIAQYYIEIEKYNTALNYLEKALKINNDYTTALISYFQILFSLNKKEKIKKTINEMIDKSLKSKISFFYNLKYESDITNLLFLLKNNSNFIKELSIGLWDYYLKTINKNKIKKFKKLINNTENLKNNIKNMLLKKL